MAAAALWRAWRSKIPSSTHGGNTGGNDDGRSLQLFCGGSSASGTSTSATTTTTGTTTSDPVQELSLDLNYHPEPMALVVEEITEENFFHHEPMAPVVEEIIEEDWVKTLEPIKALVVRFRSDSSAPEIWLSELKVDWVHLTYDVTISGSFISGQLLHLARSWTLALFEIIKSIFICFRWCSIKKDGPPSAAEFTRFFEVILSKMLPFVDAIVAVTISTGTNHRPGSTEQADEKLQALILLRDALSTASEQIQPPCVEFIGERRDLLKLLSAELLMVKLDEATWNTIEEAKTAGVIMSSSWLSSDIHPITRSIIKFVVVLWANNSSVSRILYDAFRRGQFVRQNGNWSLVTNLTVEMVHSLEEKLTRMSQLFPDQSIKFLFLINNFDFILQQLRPQLWPLGFGMPELAGKINDYVNSYIQASWAPVLKCLHNPTPLRFTGPSPLPKFETKFQQTYTAQKLWKVPDPLMRKRMRDTIVQKVMPEFKEFLKDNTNSAPRITPQEMEMMLQELFEG